MRYYRAKTIIFLILFIPFVVWAQTDENFSLSSCFDNYTFGSINLDKIVPEKKIYEQGEIIKLKGLIENNNDYPIVNGSVFMRLSHLGSSANPDKNSDTIIDEFFAPDNINILGGGAYPFKFDYQLPPSVPAGKYQLATYFVVGKKFNLSGLSFVSNVPGGLTEFEIRDGPKLHYYIDRNSFKINDQEYNFRDFTPIFSNGKEVKIKFKLKNISDTKAEGQVSFELYQWDSLLEENLFESEQRDIIIGAKQDQDITKIFKNLPPNAYLLKIISALNQQTTIANVRFAIEGKRSRINFVALKKFPFKRNDIAEYFTCFHSSTGSSETFEGLIDTAIYDVNGIKLKQDIYQGTIYPEVYSYESTFNVGKNVNFLRINAKALDNQNHILDSADLNYDCFVGANIVNKIVFSQDSEKIFVYGLNWCGQKIPVNFDSVIIKNNETNEIVFAFNNITPEILETVKLPAGKYNGVFQSGPFILEKDFIVTEQVSQIKNQSANNFNLSVLLGLGLIVFVLMTAFYILKKNQKNEPPQ